MGFLRPKRVRPIKNADPAPGGGGGGATLQEWTDITLSADNFVTYANKAAGNTGYTLTWNGDGSLTVTNAGNTTRKWEANATQVGLVLLFKTVLDPRPGLTVPGTTPGLWRAEDSTLQFQVDMDECQPGGPDTHAQGIAGGCGFVNFTNDQGSNPGAPSYSSTTHGGSTYCAQFQAASGNPGNDVWYPISSSGYANVTPPQGAVAWNSPTGMTRANVRVGAGGQNLAAKAAGRSVKAHCWTEDARVQDGGIEYGQSHGCSAHFVLDQRYYYAALFVQLRNGTAQPTSVTFRNFRYLVQPIRNRSL